jgi:hypothetical protein
MQSPLLQFERRLGRPHRLQLLRPPQRATLTCLNFPLREARLPDSDIVQFFVESPGGGEDQVAVREVGEVNDRQRGPKAFANVPKNSRTTVSPWVGPLAQRPSIRRLAFST